MYELIQLVSIFIYVEYVFLHMHLTKKHLYLAKLWLKGIGFNAWFDFIHRNFGKLLSVLPIKQVYMYHLVSNALKRIISHPII